MTDDVKAAVEHLRGVAKWPTESMHRRSARVLLAHLDGEDARTAAAVAAKAEEVRAACAQAAAHWAREAGLAYGEPSHLFDAVMAAPLDSTPLADEMRDERIAWMHRAEKAEAERDAMRLEVESLVRDMVAMTATANAEVAAGLAIAAERDALRAQLLSERERMGRWLTAPDGKQYERGTVQDVFDECDALRAQVADAFKATGRAPGVDESLTAAVEQVVLSRDAAEERCLRWFQKACGLTLEFASLQTEAAVLRAQVEAARARCYVMSLAPSAVRQGAASDILAAMDGAKP